MRRRLDAVDAAACRRDAVVTITRESARLANVQRQLRDGVTPPQDKDKDGELDKEEVLEGMNKLLGKDVLEEWNMFENFFAYIDTDGNGTIDRDEFAEFVTSKPQVKTIRRQSQQFDSPKQVYENFHGTFQGDKHKGGQKAFGSYGVVVQREFSGQSNLRECAGAARRGKCRSV